jgi:hypothetical protein
MVGRARVTEPTKVCNGPAHAQPTRLPLGEQHWYYHRRGPQQGQPLDRCKLCANWSKLTRQNGPHGTVALADVQAYAQELLDRCGNYAAAFTAHGIRDNTLRPITRGEVARVQLRTVQRILAALGEQRRNDRRNGTSARFLAARRAQAWRDERIGRLVGY